MEEECRARGVMQNQYRSFHFPLPIEFFGNTRNYHSSQITVRGYIFFQEVDRQFFSSTNIFVSPAVWALLSTDLPHFSLPPPPLEMYPIMGLTDITGLKKKKKKVLVPKPVFYQNFATASDSDK